MKEIPALDLARLKTRLYLFSWEFLGPEKVSGHFLNNILPL